MIKTIMIVVMLLNVQVIHYNAITIQAVDNNPKLVLLGDSITDIKNHENSYSDKLNYLWSKKGIKVINEGIGGTCLRDVDVSKRITQYHPKYLIIEYGLNDVAKYGNATKFYDHYNRILNETIQQNQNITIFLSTITWINETEFYSFLGSYPEATQFEFKDKIVQIANERNLTLANLWDKFYRNESLLCDGAHQNELGASVIAKTFNDTFSDLIDGSPFSYSDEVKVPNFIHFNLNLCLNLNIKVEEDINYIPLIAVMFSTLIALSISAFLFEKRKEIIIITRSGGE